MPAATFAEAKTNLTNAIAAVATAVGDLALRTAQLENARTAFLLLTPADGGFDAAATLLKGRRLQYNAAHRALDTARSQLEEAREDCARLAP